MKNDKIYTQCALINLTGGFTFGYTCAGISGVLTKIFPALLKIHPNIDNPWILSSIISSINFGGLIGSALVPYASQKLQPCSMILLGCAFNICIFLGMLSPSFVLHFTSRLLTGVGVGVICTVCPAYVAEVSPPSYRGALSGFFQVSIALGKLIASAVSHVVMGKMRDMSADEIYQMMTRSQISNDVLLRKCQLLLIPALIAPAGLCISVFHHLTVIKDITEPFNLKHNFYYVLNFDSKKFSSSSVLESIKYYRRSLLIAVICTVALQLTGINAIWFYIFRVLNTTGMNHQSIASVFIMVVNFMVTTGASVLCDHIGRRPLLIGGLFVMSFSLIALAYVEKLMKWCRIASSSAAQFSLVLFIITSYICGFGVGIGVNFWVVCNEVLPKTIYQEAFALVNCLKWFFLMFVTLLFPVAEKYIGRLVFLPFALISCLTAIFFIHALPETKGLPKEQIEKLLVP